MFNLKEMISAIAQLEEEKGISRETMIETIESAVATAYKKEYGERGQVIKSKIDMETGGFSLWQEKLVVDESMLKSEEEEEEEVYEKEKDLKEDIAEGEEDVKVRFNPERHIMLEDAQKEDKKLKAEDILVINLEFRDDFGRIAVQTAKQVVVQKIREAERGAVYDEFSEKIDTIISGTVQRIEKGYVFFDVGKTTCVMTPKDRMLSDYYRVGARMRLYVVDVEKGTRGPQIVVSRSHPKMLEKLFEMEVPEIGSGVLEIKSIAREAGIRSKVAVHSNDGGVDPIGSCVGQGGTRVSAVIQELGGEKIDIIGWSENVDEFVASALSPARVLDVEISEEGAKVIVASDQLSLAIGKDGQNVRLAAKLTDLKIDIISKETGKVEESSGEDVSEENEEKQEVKPESEDKAEEKSEKEDNPEENEKDKTKEKKEKKIEQESEDVENVNNTENEEDKE